MHKMLEEILKKTREDLKLRRERIPEETLRTMVYATDPLLGTLKKALLQSIDGTVSLIGEIKLDILYAAVPLFQQSCHFEAL